MSDIFVSYASADRERAKVVAEALAARGLTVWWDRNIPPGRQFDEVIEEALDAARCVVVLWSQTSTASTWVKTEAAEALRGKSLVPAIIEEGVRIPLEFRRLQAADLSGWRGDPTDPQLLQFFESIEAELRRSGESGAPPAARAEAPAAATPKAPPPPPAAPVSPANRVEPAPSRKVSPVAIGAIAAVVVLLIGGGLYYERSASIAAAEKAARDKAAAEQVEREKAAAEKAAAEKAAAEKAEREAAQRKAEETAKAKAPPVPQRQAQSQGPASAQGQGVPAAGVLNLKWRDSALGFAGALTWSPSSAVLRASVTDLRTGTSIGNYTVPALINQQGPLDYVVTAEFAVPGDSTTPGPHTHTSRLMVRAREDGSLSLLQNCPRLGECY